MGNCEFTARKMHQGRSKLDNWADIYLFEFTNHRIDEYQAPPPNYQASYGPAAQIIYHKEVELAHFFVPPFFVRMLGKCLKACTPPDFTF